MIGVGRHARPRRGTRGAASRRLAHLTRAGEHLHAPVRAGMEDVRARAKPRHAARDLCDDLVILCRRGKAEAALQSLREIMGKLKLTVNEEKTRICKAPEGEFDFLGYTFGRMFSARTGQARIGYRPSKKNIQRVVEKVHALTDRAGTWQETTTLVGKVNRMKTSLMLTLYAAPISRLRPRHVVPKAAQAYEPEVPVEVREWISPAPSSPDFVREVLSESRMREICTSGSIAFGHAEKRSTEQAPRVVCNCAIGRSHKPTQNSKFQLGHGSRSLASVNRSWS